MTDETHFEVKFASGQRINLDELRQRASAFMPDNGHAWIIQAVFGLDDPEQALDDMSLDAKNFVGVGPISCLLCHERYRSVNRFHKCPQHLPANG